MFERKSLKWWKKVFFWMVEVIVVNSYILYSSHRTGRRKLSHKEFRRELIISLCQPLLKSSPVQHNQHDCSIERLLGQHYPETGRKRRDCRVCSSRGVDGERHLTNTFCATCSDHPALCIGKCYKYYYNTTHL